MVPSVIIILKENSRLHKLIYTKDLQQCKRDTKKNKRKNKKYLDVDKVMLYDIIGQVEIKIIKIKGENYGIKF